MIAIQALTAEPAIIPVQTHADVEAEIARIEQSLAVADQHHEIVQDAKRERLDGLRAISGDLAELEADQKWGVTS